MFQEETKAELKNIFKDAGRGEKKRTRDEEENGKKKMSALEEIMAEEKKRKKIEKVEEKEETAAPWLRKNIVVKIVAKSLGDKYYKKKGYIKELVDDYVGLVVVNDTGAKLKLDQEHLETVIPQVCCLSSLFSYFFKPPPPLPSPSPPPLLPPTLPVFSTNAHFCQKSFLRTNSHSKIKFD